MRRRGLILDQPARYGCTDATRPRSCATFSAAPIMYGGRLCAPSTMRIDPGPSGFRTYTAEALSCLCGAGAGGSPVNKQPGSRTRPPVNRLCSARPRRQRPVSGSVTPCGVVIRGPCECRWCVGWRRCVGARSWACRKHHGTTAFPLLPPASSLENPSATACQKRCRCSRRAAGGRPGDSIAGLPVAASAHSLGRPIHTPPDRGVATTT